MLLPALAIGLAAGCGSPYETANVSGRVTLDGTPVVDATVNFQPIADSSAPTAAAGPGSYATTGQDGRFELKLVDSGRPGAMVGKHRVLISTARDEQPDDDTGQMLDETVPPRFRDGSVIFEVPADGTDAADFELGDS